MEPMSLGEEMPQIGDKAEGSSKEMPTPSTEQRLTDILNQLEVRVEKLRKDACRIEEEKEYLLATLDAVKDSEWLLEFSEVEKDSIRHSIDRLINHCLSIETAIKTTRNQQQEESLFKVNDCIDRLVVELRDNPVAACERCHIFIKTCSVESTFEGSTYRIDSEFEAAVLGCSPDDQKKVRKRLQGLLDYFTGVQFTEI